MGKKEPKKYSNKEVLKVAWAFTSSHRGLLFTSFVSNLFFSFFSAITIALINPILSYLFQTESPTKKSTGIEIGFFERLKENFLNFLKQLVDVQGDVEASLINLGLLIIVLFIIKNIFKYLSAVLGNVFNENVIKDIRDKVFNTITSLSVEYFNRQKQGTLISKITNDVAVLNNSTIASITTITRDSVSVIIFIFFLLAISVKLTLIAFSTSILSLLFIRFSVKFLKRYASRMQNAMADFTTTLQEAVGGIRVIKAYNAKDSANKRFKEDTDRYVKSAVKHKKIVAIIPAINEIWAILALCVVLIVGGREVLVEGTIKADDLMTFLFMLFAVMSPITNLVNAFSNVQRGIVAGERILDILREKPTVPEGEKHLVGFRDSIKLNNVSFSYDFDKVVKNVNIELKKGKKIALVGGSGSGKSTILDLVTRFYDPTEGNIEIDGQDIKEIKLSEYRSLFGIVSQETILFNDTIANNIKYGRDEIDREKIMDSARISNAFAFIEKLSEGIDTEIGDRGLNLSGGERQRVAIARALVRDPEILIFDEATSALDAESEKTVQEAIDNSLKDKTAIIVAHRLSTIVNCDEIYVFKDGEIVEKGTHKDLIDAEGIYKRLYEIQFAG